MPSQKPRIALTVDNDLNSLLEELSQLTKQPKSKIIVDMLRDAEPHLKEIVNALKMVQDTKNSKDAISVLARLSACLLYTSPSPRDRTRSRMPSSA